MSYDKVMKITLKVKLMTTKEQSKSLLETMEEFNKACNWISGKSFDAGLPYQVKLHHLVYFEARSLFPNLTSQMIIRAIAKVCDSYQLNKKVCHSFKPHGAMEYDKRILSFKDLSHASMSTINGRITVPIVFGHYVPLDRNRMCGQADLIYSNGKFFLNIVVDIPDGTPIDPKGFLGIDMGIVNLSTDSDGESFSGETVDRVREKIHALKKALQKKGTKAAKRHLKKMSEKESRFKKDTNHVISKRIVSKAKGTGRGIAIEDLKGFNGQQMVRKSQKERFGKWAFDQLRRFITYKALLSGVPVVAVNSRNTSRTCSSCGHCDKANRKSQAHFSCLKCEYTENADINAARNIAFRATVNEPVAV